jgi:signal transduction histidine kinase
MEAQYLMYKESHIRAIMDGGAAINRVTKTANRRNRPTRMLRRDFILELRALGGGDMQPIRVLVIEDSTTQVQLIRGMLSKTGSASFDVEVFHELAPALNRLAAEDLDIILLDLTLPDSEGLESCRRVAESAPALPIVVLTGVDDEEIAISALQCGAQDYLMKGQIDGNLLARSLRYAIERKRAELELKRARDELELRVEERTAEIRRMEDAARKQQDELAHIARLNTLGEMASGLAHELNQPLTALIGFTYGCTQLLDADDVEIERVKQYMKEASAEAKRAGEIIQRMRRLVSKRPPQQTLVDINELVRDTIPLLKPGLDVHLEVNLAEDLPRVMADKVQIQQVLLNIARNAVQAMDAVDTPKRKLTIKTEVLADERCVFIEVSDTGPGMPPEDLNRLFEPFFTRKSDGLGLGLSISRSIMEAHAGQLLAQPNPQGGLTFRCTLPLRRQNKRLADPTSA